MNREFSASDEWMDENLKREEFAQCWLKAEPSISAYVFAAVAGFHDAEDVVQRIAIDELALFDKAVSDMEIADLYQAALEEMARSE